MVAAINSPIAGKPADAKKPEPKLLHQVYFKSVGPRTYASQLKECANGNHMLLISEGKREENGDLRMTRLCVFSEDFPAFFKMLKETEAHIQTHPLPEAVRNRRRDFWAKQATAKPEVKSGAPAAVAPTPAPSPKLQTATATGKQMRPARAMAATS
jgi:hypothetical protein